VSRTRTQAEQQLSDTALMRRILEGDETALAAVYDRYSGIVYSVASRILRDRGAAEEVLQDIFYQLWRTAYQFDLGRGSLPGWLLVMSRNRAIDRLRRRTRSSEETPPDPVPMASNLETQAARNELVAKVKTAIETMAAGQREALEMAYFEGMTQAEIAARTGEPLGTVKTRLRSALRELKKAMDP
jgi:RNA polymerase sigma-70 factor (ECF subfamily)